jgi:hypothetical protein
MLRAAILLLPLLLGACAHLTSREPAVLPPPPRDWFRVSPLTAPPEVSASVDSVIEHQGSTARDLRLPRGVSDAELQARPRFEQPLPGRPAAEPGRPAPDLQWRRMETGTESIGLNASWPRLHAAMPSGTVVQIRDIVWPEPAMVMRREPDRLVIATGWIDARRMPANELQCAVTEDPRKNHLAEGGEVRMAAEVRHRETGGGEVYTWLETRRMGQCNISLIALDRLASFRGDILIAGVRATAPSHQLIGR